MKSKWKNKMGLLVVILLIAIAIIVPVMAEGDVQTVNETDLVQIANANTDETVIANANTDETVIADANTDEIVIADADETIIADADETVIADADETVIADTDKTGSAVQESAVPEAVSVTVTSPNGGENWVRGTTRTVKWSSSGIIGNVKIELLKGGVFKQTIVASTPNDGSHPWAIPIGQTLGNDYKVRITSISNPAIKDTSNFNFIISAGFANAKLFSNKKVYTRIPLELVQLTLQSTGTAPIWVKQNEPWKIINVATGKTINLPICTPVGYGSCAPKKLLPGKKIQKSWNQKDSSGNLVPLGTYVTSAKFYKQNPSSGSPTAFIVFTVFTIVKQPSITVVSPNGGENWKRGTTHTISWSRIGNTGASVKIELLKGGVVNSVINPSTANDGSYSWAIPAGQTLGGNYKVRITSTLNPLYKDTSNSNFVISS